MNKFLQKIIVTIVCLVSLLALIPTNSVAASVANYNNDELNLNVKSAVAIDQKNGQVLYAKNGNQKLPIASMSKLVTVYLTLDAIKSGKLTWNQKLTPTANIVKISKNTEYSNVPLELKHQYTVKQLYEATLIESANGAAMMLGQAVYGTQKNAVDHMRQIVKKWGIKGAKFYTTCGLPNGSLKSDAYPGAGKNSENEVSANDMAIIVDHLLTKYPEVLKTTKIAKLAFKDGTKTTQMENWNWMLKGLSQYDAAFPLDGLKTGTTDQAGACFAGTLKYKGRRIITIVMGASHTDGSDPSRFTQTKKLLNYIYQNYNLYILKKGQQLSSLKGIKVKDGKSRIANLVVQKDTGLWLKSADYGKVTFSKDNLTAPLNKGDRVGYYYFKLANITSNHGTKVPATVKENVEQVNIFVRLWRSIFGD